MDLKVLFVTFSLIFLSELGDKSQLATMFLAVNSSSTFAVLLGSSLALILTTLMGVIFGQTVTQIFPQWFLVKIAGGGFVILGLFLLVGRVK